jgi:predicted transcriptional regulator of viral defense system
MKRAAIRSKRQRGSKQELALAQARRVGAFRPRDLAVPRSYLARWLRKGLIERVSRGLYSASGADISENHATVEACKRVPHGVICLISALRMHNLGTQIPHQVWLAIDRTARNPRIDYPPIRIVRMSGAARTAGIEQHVFEGVAVRVYSPAKTIADCFKFRNKIGLDVALEALRDFWISRGRNIDDLWRFASICRVANVMRPYLEMLAV